MIAVLALLSQAAAAPLALPCEAEGAIGAEIIDHNPDGIVRISGGYRIRLANIIWPDHLEPSQRSQLQTLLTEALKGQQISWKPAAGPDRWGITPAHIFVREAGGTLAPFWLQAGLVEGGFAPAWPEPFDAVCWKKLVEHEATAIKARRGHWAPRAQAARHRTIEAAREAHAGRKIAALWRVKSVRPWRTMHFVNFVPSFRGGPSLSLTRKQMSLLEEARKNPTLWQGKWVITRFIVGSQGLSRIRVESIDHIGPVE